MAKEGSRGAASWCPHGATLWSDPAKWKLGSSGQLLAAVGLECSRLGIPWVMKGDDKDPPPSVRLPWDGIRPPWGSG